MLSNKTGSWYDNWIQDPQHDVSSNKGLKRWRYWGGSGIPYLGCHYQPKIFIIQLILKVINKVNEAQFTPNDESVFEKYLQFCGIGLRNAQLYERSQLEVKRNQVLLDLAGVIFQEQSTIDNTIDRILTHMLSLIR